MLEFGVKLMCNDPNILPGRALKGCRVSIAGEVVELEFGVLQIELKSLLSKQSVLLTIKV